MFNCLTQKIKLPERGSNVNESSRFSWQFTHDGMGSITLNGRITNRPEVPLGFGKPSISSNGPPQHEIILRACSYFFTCFLNFSANATKLCSKCGSLVLRVSRHPHSWIVLPWCNLMYKHEDLTAHPRPSHFQSEFMLRSA